MARRYENIKKGLEYQTGLDNYVEYLRNPANRTTKRMVGGTRGARRSVVPAAVKPFGIELAAGEYLRVTISASSNTALATAISTRTFISGANLTGATKLSKFSPARVNAFFGSGTASYAQSKVTKLWYLKYEGDSHSAPFGALTDTEEEQIGSRAVRAAVITAGGSADIKRVSITPEKVPV